METKIPRGKVIRVPADIKLKGSQSQYMPHIIADADKIKSVIEDLSKIFCLTGLPFNALEWIAPETFPQYKSLTSARQNSLFVLKLIRRSSIITIQMRTCLRSFLCST